MKTNSETGCVELKPNEAVAASVAEALKEERKRNDNAISELAHKVNTIILTYRSDQHNQTVR